MLSLLKQLTLFKRIFSNGDIQRPLGRWSLVDDSRKAYRRSELANEDHCGTCATYAMRQSDKNIQKIHVPLEKNQKK
tara:strand:+ start:2588 stop:2818 length:231 start_codon:yes stop_codon:yes gene_type:complete